MLQNCISKRYTRGTNLQREGDTFAATLIDLVHPKQQLMRFFLIYIYIPIESQLDIITLETWLFHVGYG